MRPAHLLRVEGGPEPFAQLLAAVAAAGLRAGWLELLPPGPAAASLEAAAALGAKKAVAAGGGRSVALKPLRGEPVLRDLVREHFPGCALVLVSGAPEAPATPAASASRAALTTFAAPASPPPLPSLPALSPAGEGWRIAPAGGAAARLYDTAGLVAALRRPHPWGPPGAEPAPPPPDAPPPRDPAAG